MITRQQGVTILETLLAIAISAVVVIMAMQQYTTYKLSSDAEKIKADVDRVAQAAAYYYKANCGVNDPSFPSITHALAPTVTTNPVTLNVQTDLLDKGLLANAIPLNPLLDTASGYRGYFVQFNRLANSTRYVCTQSSTGTTDPYSADCTVKSAVGTVVRWQIQISAKLNNSGVSEAMRRITDASCVTSSNGTDSVVNCDSAPAFGATCQLYNAWATSGWLPAFIRAIYQSAFNNLGCQSSNGEYNNYLSFVRPASMPTAPEGQSGLWVSNARLHNFKEMYETEDVNMLLQNSGNAAYQYFTCGD